MVIRRHIFDSLHAFPLCCLGTITACFFPVGTGSSNPTPIEGQITSGQQKDKIPAGMRSRGSKGRADQPPVSPGSVLPHLNPGVVLCSSFLRPCLSKSLKVGIV